MGKIYCIMGKSASGKDTLFARMLEECPKMRRFVTYTTRPMREGESEGTEYHFTDEASLKALEDAGKLIEKRTYSTVFGPWSYATVDDGQIHLDRRNYLYIGTIESYVKIRDYFGHDKVRPVFLEIDPGIRLQRALNRERMQKEPKYAEMCRRFLADEEDFSDDKVYAAGITRRYVNEDLNECLARIIEDIEEDS